MDFLVGFLVWVGMSNCMQWEYFLDQAQETSAEVYISVYSKLSITLEVIFYSILKNLTKDLSYTHQYNLLSI